MSATTTDPAAVLGDLGAVYQVSVAIAKESSAQIELNYQALKAAITDHFKLSHQQDKFVVWSGSDDANQGQQRLFQFLERLNIKIWGFEPRDSYVIEPEKLGLDPAREPQHKMLLLQRFSGSIAYAAGKLCNEYRIIFLTDSFQLAQPLVDASALAVRRGQAPAGLVFWKSHLDPRWHQIIEEYKIDFLDLDKKQGELFRARGQHAGKAQQVRRGFGGTSPIDKD